MLEKRQLIVPQGLRAQIDHAYRAPEHQMVQDLLKAAQLDP